MKGLFLCSEFAQKHLFGLGGSVFGGTHWGTQSDKASMDALIAAVDSGAGHIDTAASYGNGRSETVIGRFLSRYPSKRDHLIIASKGGLKGSSTNFLKTLDASRRRLHCETIDIYYVHWPVAGVDPGPTLDALARAREDGRIRYAGVSNFSPAELLAAHRRISLDACQFGLNMVWRKPMAELIPLCRRLELACISYGSLAQGLLGGTHTPGEVLPAGDDRGLSIFFDPEFFQCVSKGSTALQDLVRQTGVLIPRAAMEWIQQYASVDAALIGARNRDQAVQNFSSPPPIDRDVLLHFDEAARHIYNCFSQEENIFRNRP